MGAIKEILKEVFGEIGGHTELDLLSFSESKQKGVLRVPLNFKEKLQVAVTLISSFQGVPAIFQIEQSTTKAANLLISI